VVVMNDVVQAVNHFHRASYRPGPISLGVKNCRLGQLPLKFMAWVRRISSGMEAKANEFVEKRAGAYVKAWRTEPLTKADSR
jgi:hypothetical protein